MTPARRVQLLVWISWVVLIISIIGWPLSAVTVFADEPQGILGLSWAAIILSCANTLLTAYVKADTTE